MFDAICTKRSFNHWCFVFWSLFRIYLPASDASLRASDFEFLTEKMGFSVNLYSIALLFHSLSYYIKFQAF